MHPEISKGGGINFISDFFWEICIMTTHSELQTWKKEGIKFALKAEQRLQEKKYSSDNNNNSDNEFFNFEYCEPITLKEGQYELSHLKQFLHALSVNLVFDASFIKNSRKQQYNGYCPCHTQYNDWNAINGMKEIIADRDICRTKKGNKCYLMGTQGMKSHISKRASYDSLHSAMKIYVDKVFSKQNVEKLNIFIAEGINNLKKKQYSMSVRNHRGTSDMYSGNNNNLCTGNSSSWGGGNHSNTFSAKPIFGRVNGKTLPQSNNNWGGNTNNGWGCTNQNKLNNTWGGNTNSSMDNSDPRTKPCCIKTASVSKTSYQQVLIDLGLANQDRDKARKNLGLKENVVKEKNTIIRNKEKEIKDLGTRISGNASEITKLKKEKSKIFIDLEKKIKIMLI